MTSTIIFLSIFLLLLSMLLIMDIQTNINLDDFNIVVIVKLYSLKVITIYIDLRVLKFKIGKNGKLRSLGLIVGKEQKYLLMQIKKSVLDKLYYDQIELETNINTGDPALTANIVGLLNMFSSIISLSNQHKGLDFVFNHKAEFVVKTNRIDAKIKVYFTIFDMLFAVIMSFYKRGRYAKQKK